MRHTRKSLVAAIAAGVVLVTSPCAHAQKQDWFVPGGNQQQRPAQGRAPAHQRPGPRLQPQQQEVAPLSTPGPMGMPGVASAPEAPPRPVGQFQLPPAPSLPPINKGATPPAAVIGVLGVPEIMRACTAAQEIEKVIGERRQKLNEDAQKEQAAWRDLQQKLVNERSTLSADQIRARERELQERITNAQRQFRDRNRVIQEAAQFALAQIERTLIAVIRQVADSRGMNLVLHRNQVVLNVNEFDLTDAATAQLNKVLPSVTIPADGVEPPTIPLAQGSAPPQAAQPLAAPVSAAPSAQAPSPAASKP